MAWRAWYRVARWPRANAVLVSKDISSVGARLEFRYTVRGETSTAVGFRWGSEASVQHDLELYTPGTVHEIAFNPQEPSEIEPNLRYDYSLFGGAIGALVGAALFIIGGWGVLRRSKDDYTDAPTGEPET